MKTLGDLAGQVRDHEIGAGARDRGEVLERDRVAVDPSVGVPRPGDIVTAEITYAAPHHLVADRVLALRRTRAGDVSDRSPEPAGVLLGMPVVRS